MGQNPSIPCVGYFATRGKLVLLRTFFSQNYDLKNTTWLVFMLNIILDNNFMKKSVLLIALALTPLIARAESQLSVGLGMPYGGGLGGKYAVNYDAFKLYAGAGLLGYTSWSGAEYGGSVGFEYHTESNNSSLGLSYGAVGLSFWIQESVVYLGPAINYSYYFSGFNSASWIIGASIFQGKGEVPGYSIEDEKKGVSFMFGYQF